MAPEYPQEIMDQVVAEAGTRTERERFGTSYVARLAYRGDIVRPPEVPGVRGAIDTHCHAHPGQQDALAVAKHASKNGMGGILYKTIVGGRPAEDVRQVEQELARWCDVKKLQPARLWSAFGIGRFWDPIDYKVVREQIDDGVSAVWMPVFLHANTLNKVATIRPDESDPERRSRLLPPLSFEEATKVGYYLLDSHGKLLPEVREIIHLVADRDVALSFGHATRPEQIAMVEEIEKLGYGKAFIDHPFSPFMALTLDEMRQFTASGVYLNFTYDELSPLLGINPMTMFDAIQAVGTGHIMLSSDAGEPLFPDSVECMRMMRAYGTAFGLTPDQIYETTVTNPARILNAA